MAALVTTALVLVAATFQPANGALPFVGRVGQLALAGGAAYLLDDAAAAVTTVAPQRTWRRRAPALAVGGAMLAAAWFVILLLLDWRHSRPPVLESSAELLVMCLVAIAAAALLFRSGDLEPGAAVAPLVVAVGLGVTFAEFALSSPIFLTGAHPTGERVAGWMAAGTLALMMIVVAGGSRGRARTGHARGAKAGLASGRPRFERRSSP
jgi:hypothetical protein